MEAAPDYVRRHLYLWKRLRPAGLFFRPAYMSLFFEDINPTEGRKFNMDENMDKNVVVVDIEGLEEGMLAADDMMAFDGTIVVHKGMELEGRHMMLLKRALVSMVRVVIPKEKAKPKETIHINDYEDHVPHLKMARILIVDDSKYLRFKLEKMLTAAGLTVVGQATNGNEAVEMAAQLNPNVITLDIEMPYCDGIAALAPLRQTVPDALVLMISSLGEEDKILESLAKGAFDFITKPIDPVKTVKSVINAIIIERSYK